MMLRKEKKNLLLPVLPGHALEMNGGDSVRREPLYGSRDHLSRPNQMREKPSAPY